MTVKADFHVHTIYSPDAAISFDQLCAACKDKGIDVVSIMDHDEIKGAIEFHKRAEEMRSNGEWAPRIIIGEEVRTAGGEICGMFLNKWVPDHKPPRDTMEMIKEQGGLVYVPHPFDLLKLKRLKAKELVELADLIDIIEVFNGKPRTPGANERAARFLEENPIAAAGAGSDCHEPSHLGAAHVELDDFNGPDDLVDKLGNGNIHGERYSPFTTLIPRLVGRRELAKAAKD
ncbi:MAG: PHP domain-containing protein [Actinobacteria bacterium]|nr:PHP domain-containing protein [Actinomycetota bacterium]